MPLLNVRQTDEILIIPCEPPSSFATQTGTRRRPDRQIGGNFYGQQFLLDLRPGTVAHVLTTSARYAGRFARPVQTETVNP